MPSGSILVCVVQPTARVSHLGSTAATVALAGLPAVVTVARGGTDLGAAVLLLVLGTGASLAWAVDDPTQDLLAATPVSAPVRASVRILAAAVVAGLVITVALGVIAAGPGLAPDLADRLPEGAAAGAVALAVAFGAARRGERMVGSTGAIAGILLPAFVAGLALRWPSWFPGFEGGLRHTRWWLLVAAGVLLAASNGRDPARR